MDRGDNMIMNYIAHLKNNKYNVFLYVDCITLKDGGYEVKVSLHHSINEEYCHDYGKLLSLIEKHKAIFLYSMQHIKKYNPDYIEITYKDLMISHSKHLFVDFCNPMQIEYKNLWSNEYIIK